MDGFAWNGVLNENFRKFNSVFDRFHKDDDLIELELINQVHQLSNLLTLVKLNVILAETVKRQFALVLNQHFSWVAHELAASQLNVTGERGREHHHLLVDWSVFEDLLDVRSHVYCSIELIVD